MPRKSTAEKIVASPEIQPDPPHTTHVYTEADNEPVSRPELLRMWWAPDMVGYTMYKVKVLGRKTTAKRDLLEFELAGNYDLLKKKRDRFTVDLNLSELCWRGTPSSAQRARRGQYAFLLLSTRWAEQNNVDRFSRAFNGSKFPIINGL